MASQIGASVARKAACLAIITLGWLAVTVSAGRKGWGWGWGWRQVQDKCKRFVHEKFDC